MALGLKFPHPPTPQQRLISLLSRRSAQISALAAEPKPKAPGRSPWEQSSWNPGSHVGFLQEGNFSCSGLGGLELQTQGAVFQTSPLDCKAAHVLGGSRSQILRMGPTSRCMGAFPVGTGMRLCHARSRLYIPGKGKTSEQCLGVSLTESCALSPCRALAKGALFPNAESGEKGHRPAPCRW